MTKITPVEITHAVDATWTDVDVTAHLGADAGDVAGVVLRSYNHGGTLNWGVRKNGSTDAFFGDQLGGSHQTAFIGVDSNDVFELYLEDASETDCYIIGYITNAEGVFDTNLTNVASGITRQDNTWQDIDISSDTGANTALAVFLLIDNTLDSHCTYGLRENGSTDSINVGNGQGDLPTQYMSGAGMAVDENEIFEVVIEDNGSPSGDFAMYMAGYLTANFTSFTNMKSYTPSSAGAYEDWDLSADVPSGNTGIGFNINHSSSVDYAIRDNGESFDVYDKFSWEKTYGWNGIDDSQIAERKFPNTGVTHYVWGYTSAPAGASGIRSMRQMVGHGQGTRS